MKEVELLFTGVCAFLPAPDWHRAPVDDVTFVMLDLPEARNSQYEADAQQMDDGMVTKGKVLIPPHAPFLAVNDKFISRERGSYFLIPNKLPQKVHKVWFLDKERLRIKNIIKEHEV